MKFFSPADDDDVAGQQRCNIADALKRNIPDSSHMRDQVLHVDPPCWLLSPEDANSRADTVGLAAVPETFVAAIAVQVARVPAHCHLRDRAIFDLKKREASRY